MLLKGAIGGIPKWSQSSYLKVGDSCDSSTVLSGHLIKMWKNILPIHWNTFKTDYAERRLYNFIFPISLPKYDTKAHQKLNYELTVLSYVSCDRAMHRQDRSWHLVYSVCETCTVISERLMPVSRTIIWPHWDMVRNISQMLESNIGML